MDCKTKLYTDDGIGQKTSEGMTVGEALRWAASLFSAQGIDSPQLEAQILLGHVLDLTRSQLYIHLYDPLCSKNASRYRELVQRRLEHEPVAYLTGRRAFYDVDLYVDENVLIPRPESEHLIEAARAWAQERERSSLRVVDVGTGSAALAIVLARHLPDARVWAVDISFEALRVAARNVRRHDLGGHIALVCGDLLRALTGPFDLIVANLPYIPREEISSLPTNVAMYEPHRALDGGERGLEVVRRLLFQSVQKLTRPGLLLLEIDPRQAEAVTEMAHRAFYRARVNVLQDYAKRDRVMEIRRGE
ncbi:MAG: peptide chain release factor N(5)-glutamine methyltransferase [Anaerolineae bacterium]